MTCSASPAQHRRLSIACSTLLARDRSGAGTSSAGLPGAAAAVGGPPRPGGAQAAPTASRPVPRVLAAKSAAAMGCMGDMSPIGMGDMSPIHRTRSCRMRGPDRSARRLAPACTRPDRGASTVMGVDEGSPSAFIHNLGSAAAAGSALGDGVPYYSRADKNTLSVRIPAPRIRGQRNVSKLGGRNRKCLAVVESA